MLETRGLGFELCSYGWGGNGVAVRLNNKYKYKYIFMYVCRYVCMCIYICIFSQSSLFCNGFSSFKIMQDRF